METSMKTYTAFHSRRHEVLQNGIPKSNEKTIEMHARTSKNPFLCSPMSEIVPGSPRSPKWEHQARQITSSGTKNAKIRCNYAKTLQFQNNERCSGAGGKGRSP